MKNRQFVYKSEDALQRMHDFYDKTLANLQVPFSEDYFETSYGKTHSLVVGNPEKPKICTIDMAVLLVPSGIAHGPVLPMISKMVVPFVKYYSHKNEETLNQVIETMGGKGDAVWREFFDIMMSSYKMEMRPPKEYSKKELQNFKAPVVIIASDSDIFFPAERVFKKAAKIFQGEIKQMKIESKHLPSDEVMKDVCKEIVKFLA